jgi:ribosomal 50S subunit-recycling heat shock protein
MRIDKFLKAARILKRRTVAAQACGLERVYVNGKIAKSAHRLKVGDVVKVDFGTNVLEFRVKMLDENPRKEDAQLLYEITSSN